MLILGVETATMQVGCAIGGHEGVLASVHSAKGKRHAEQLVPSIQFACEQARVEFTHFLRSERKFDGIEALVGQLKHDVDHARELLGL